MSEKVHVYKTKRETFSAAKEYFAVRLRIKPESVTVAVQEVTRTQCDCGESVAYNLTMTNAGPKRSRSLAIQGGNSVIYGVCKACGID